MKNINYFIFPILIVSICLTACQKEPTAGFINPGKATVGESISFINTSGNAYSYEWNFGDGNSSTETSPLHTYSTVGTYNVLLTAFSKNGKKSSEATASITVSNNVPDPSSLEQLSKDDIQVQASDDMILNDANDVLSETIIGSKAIQDSIPNSCTILIDTVGGDTLRITMAYNGFNSGHSFNRTGTVIIERPIGVQWKTTGCAVIYQYINLAITKISSGKTFVFNGVRLWTNVSGGLIKNLNGSTTIRHQITGAMQITFDNGTTRTWTIARMKTWSGTYPSALTVTASGFGSNSGYNNLVEYGTDRNGEAFYAQIATPVLYSENCIVSQWTPIWGVLAYQIPSNAKRATITYGYNSNDQLVTQGTCADYYRLDWVILSYSAYIYFMIP